jgi:hypothetical protein
MLYTVEYTSNSIFSHGKKVPGYLFSGVVTVGPSFSTSQKPTVRKSLTVATCVEQNLLRRRPGMVDQRDAAQMKQVWAKEIRLRF